MLQPITQELIQEVAAKIADKFQPEKIILFGSYAWGNPGPDSDIDLLVIQNTTTPWRERAGNIRTSLMDYIVPIDILVYTPKEVEHSIKVNRNLFIEDVVTNGTTLYAAHALRT